jgi:DNA-binding protein H-NS
MRTNYRFFCLVAYILCFATTTFAQTASFDETWKEFLENDKISNMSELIRPDKAYDRPNYAKYLLMNTNSSFCQSEVEEAESLLAEVQTIDPRVPKSIPGFVEKMDNLETKIEAYYTMDAIWKQFLVTKEVDLAELEAVTATKTSCEKTTLAKYSYLTAYGQLCQGDVSKAMDIFENRTLKLTEKTSLRVEDVEGLAGEVARMKSLFQDMSKLEIAWKAYVKSGVSTGCDLELPLFRCYPIPNMKILVLKGAADVCNVAPVMLEKIKQLQTESGVTPTGELAVKVKDLEAAIGQKDTDLAALNEAWEAFIPDNKVKHMGRYGYEYCSKEPLIRAYIMDGFAYTCEMAEDMLQKIDALQRSDRTALAEITMIKINELAALNEQYQANGVKIENLWRKFVAQGDKLSEAYQSADFYCDNIHQVKDWTMRGLAGTCEDGHQNLEQIEAFQRTFEFKFSEDLECRVQRLRIKVWDCRYEALLKLARIEAPDAYEKRLEELMAEYGIGEKPEVCSW